MLLSVNLSLLLLPLAGVWGLRLYESALVRQTESELVAQAAVIGSAYKLDWLRAAAAEEAGGAAAVARALEALPVAAPRPEESLGHRPWTPRPAKLDLTEDPLLPAPEPATPPAAPADPRAARAGETLQAVLVDAQRVTLAGMRVLDAGGVVVATTREDLGLSLAGQTEVAAALEGRPASSLRARAWSAAERTGLGSISRSADLRVFVALPVLEGRRVLGAVVLSRTPASIGQALHGKRWHLAALAAFLLLAGTGAALFTAYTVSRPIHAVAAQAKAVAAGARVSMARTRRSATREADELWAAIAAMAGTLERRADYIGAFAAEVSHEFKTPLTAIQGALELVRDHADSMTPSERDRFLANAAADAARLDRLVRRLLDLARADAPARVAAPAETVEVGRAIRAAAAPFLASGLPVRLDGPDGPVLARVGAEAFRTALANLLDNVRQHAGAGASAAIAWRLDEGRGGVVVRVSDTGPGISEGNAGRVFDRFFTTARDRGGTGLGLPIVRSRLASTGATIELARDGTGAAFVLRLPSAAASAPLHDRTRGVVRGDRSAGRAPAL